MILLEMMEHKVPYDGANDFKAATLATSGQRPALGDNMPDTFTASLNPAGPTIPLSALPFVIS